MRAGIVCRMDKTGLGSQSLRLTRLLNPHRVMLIDSTVFKRLKNYRQWYSDYSSMAINGFPNAYQVRGFLRGLNVVITCETWYNPQFIDIAKQMGVKTVLIANYEFLDHLNHPNLTLPDLMVSPSYWYLDEIKEKFNAIYLPTPIFQEEFSRAREINLDRTGKTKFLFINGKTAAQDRNGLNSLYEALKYSSGDFTVTIKAQHDINRCGDQRIIYDFTNPDCANDLYENFDALILPRRYAGQSLPMTEALQSALPVIMTDISPNNKVLPSEWLIPAAKVGQFMTRFMVDIYSADPLSLGRMMDNFDISKEQKLTAYEIGKQYDADLLLPEYKRVLGI